MYTSGKKRTSFFSENKVQRKRWKPENRILKSGIQPLMESGIHRHGIRNPQRGIRNPRLSWITLHGARKLLSLYMFHRIIFLLLIVSSLFCNFNRCAVCAVCFQSLMNIACRSSQNAARIKCFWRLHIVIKPLNKK